MKGVRVATSFGVLKEAAGAIALAAVLMSTIIVIDSHSARAQNLVQNPNFTDTDDNGNPAFYQTNGQVSVEPTDETESTFAAFVFGPGASDGDIVSSISQTILTTPGTVYTVSFLANFDPEPDLQDTLTVTFGDTTFPLSPKQPVDSTFDPFSFTATTRSSETVLTFEADNGAFAISGLDVEAAPAPLAGGGIASFCLALAGLVLHRMRRRPSVRAAG